MADRGFLSVKQIIQFRSLDSVDASLAAQPKATRIVLDVGAGTKGDGCEFKRGQVMRRLELSLGRGVEEA